MTTSQRLRRCWRRQLSLNMDSNTKTFIYVDMTSKIFAVTIRCNWREMAIPDEDTARRTAIQFCIQATKISTGTFRKMQDTERYRIVAKQAYKWHSRFSKRWMDSSSRRRPPYKATQTFEVRRVSLTVIGKTQYEKLHKVPDAVSQMHRYQLKI